MITLKNRDRYHSASAPRISPDIRALSVHQDKSASVSGRVLMYRTSLPLYQDVVYKTWCTRRGVQDVVYKTWCTRRGVQDVVYKTWCTRRGVQDVVYKTWCTRRIFLWLQ